MKRFLLVATAVALVLPDLALAQQPQDRRPRGATRPVRPGGPEVQPPRPGWPEIQPPRPGRPEIQPPRPGRPEIQPPRPGRPDIRPPRPPHRPGMGRPPNFRPMPGPGWSYPRGYKYRRWVIGVILPRLFLSNRYYFNDYYRLGIGAPPPGYRWVRYGPDLLLVGTRTGRIYDVIRHAFY